MNVLESICYECRHCERGGDNKAEPVYYECYLEMGQFGMAEGCYEFERAREDDDDEV